MSTQTIQITKTQAQGSDVYTTNCSPFTFQRSKSKIVREEVKGVPGAFILKNILSHQECKELIEFTSSLGDYFSHFRLHFFKEKLILYRLYRRPYNNRHGTRHDERYKRQ